MMKSMAVSTDKAELLKRDSSTIRRPDRRPREESAKRKVKLGKFATTHADARGSFEQALAKLPRVGIGRERDQLDWFRRRLEIGEASGPSRVATGWILR